MTCRVA
jgi:hypothetical protein